MQPTNTVFSIYSATLAFPFSLAHLINALSVLCCPFTPLSLSLSLCAGVNGVKYVDQGVSHPYPSNSGGVSYSPALHDTGQSVATPTGV